MLELVYIFVGLPLTLMRSGGSRNPKRPRVAYVRRARLFCLFLRSIPPICGVILAHVNVSSWLAALCFNGLHCGGPVCNTAAAFRIARCFLVF